MLSVLFQVHCGGVQSQHDKSCVNVSIYMDLTVCDGYAGSATPDDPMNEEINLLPTSFLKLSTLGMSCKRTSGKMRLVHAQTLYKNSPPWLSYPLSSSLCNPNHCWIYPSLSFTFSLYLLLHRSSLSSSLGYGPELFSLIRWGSQERADWCSMSNAEQLQCRPVERLIAQVKMHIIYLQSIVCATNKKKAQSCKSYSTEGDNIPDIPVSHIFILIPMAAIHFCLFSACF